MRNYYTEPNGYLESIRKALIAMRHSDVMSAAREGR